jgi:outer membrane lipoprotein SlyB
MLTSLSGVDFTVHTGEIYTCDEATAARFVDAGIAEYVRDTPVQAAIRTTSELAARVIKPSGRRR